MRSGMLSNGTNIDSPRKLTHLIPEHPRIAHLYLALYPSVRDNEVARLLQKLAENPRFGGLCGFFVCILFGIFI